MKSRPSNGNNGTSTSSILSKTFGGTRKVKTYCTMYEMKPQFIQERCLCTGGGYWSPCPDFSRCAENKLSVAVVRSRRQRNHDIERDAAVVSRFGDDWLKN
jgi:hypothetical protein